MPKRAYIGNPRGDAAYNYPLRQGHYRNVVVIEDFEKIEVRLHGNRVLTYFPNSEQVVVDNSGWITPTTRQAINNGLQQLKVNGAVSIKNFQMVWHGPYDRPVPFKYNAIIVNKNGEIIHN